jgi:drug/metabolite transporter (DMT)-like permease
MVGAELVPVLSLFAAVCVAVQTLTVESGLRRTPGSAAFTAALVTVVVSVAVFWAVLLVRGVPGGVTVEAVLPFVVAGVLNPAAFRLLYFEGIDRVGARIAATIQATYPAIATALAVLTLGETLTLLTGVGVLLIVAGGGILQFVRNSASPDAGGTTDLIARELAAVEGRDLLYPAVATVLLAVSYVLVEYGLTRLPAPTVATTAGQTTALLAFLGLLAASPGWRREVAGVSAPAYLAFAVAGVAVAAFWLAQFVALDVGSVVTVIPLVSSAPLFVVVLSYALAREVPRSPRVLLAVVTVVAGVVTIQLG